MHNEWIRIMPQAATALPKLLQPEATCSHGLRFILNDLRDSKANQLIIDEINNAARQITRLCTNTTVQITEFNRLLSEYDRLTTEIVNYVDRLPAFIADAKKMADSDNDSDNNIDDIDDRVVNMMQLLKAFEDQAIRVEQTELHLLKKVRIFFEDCDSEAGSHPVQQNYEAVETILHETQRKIHAIQKEKKLTPAKHGLDVLRDRITQNIATVMTAINAIQTKLKTAQGLCYRLVGKTPPTSPTVSVYPSSSHSSFFSSTSGSSRSRSSSAERENTTEDKPSA